MVTQNNTLDMQLTVAENLEFRSRFFGLGLRGAARRAEQLLVAFGLADRRTAIATDLSGGQAREGRVLRRNLGGTFIRAIMQPLLFVFVFTHVMPEIGGGGIFGAGAPGRHSRLAGIARQPAMLLLFVRRLSGDVHAG